MGKRKRVFKYGTGQEIPEGAIYLSTQVETKSYVGQNGRSNREDTICKNEYVWQYFLVEVSEYATKMNCFWGHKYKTNRVMNGRPHINNRTGLIV